jgi:hypothetical protein
MVTDIIDPMLDIGSLLIVAYNRKTGKVFAEPACMIVLAMMCDCSVGQHCKAAIKFNKALLPSVRVSLLDHDIMNDAIEHHC